jgi:hypothetical protein
MGQGFKVASRVSRRTRRGVLGITLAVATVVAGSCTPTPTTPSTPSAFCTLWSTEPTAPPAADNPVLVQTDVVATAASASRTGSSCTDPSAAVNLGGATLAEGQAVTTQLGGTGSATPADAQPTSVATTGPQLAAGAVVLQNLQITSFSVSIGSQGITIKGSVAVTLSGAVSTLSFSGTLASLNSWSVTLASTAMNIPGLTVAPLSFSGTLSSVNGVKSLSLSANAPSLKTGDISVTNASLLVKAGDATGVSALASGRVTVGPSTANGSVQVAFDPMGTLVSANASVSVTLIGEQPNGQLSELDGSATLVGDATTTSATFSASGHLGSTIINQASGSLTLSPDAAAFTGVFDVAQGSNTVRFSGSVNFDGLSASTPTFLLQGAGQVSGTLSDGSVVALNGSIDANSSGGASNFTVDGDIQVGSVHANGTATVTVAGTQSTIQVSGALTSPGFAGSLAGSFTINKGVATAVDLSAGLSSPVVIGDTTVTSAHLDIHSSGGPLTFSVGGAFTVGTSASLTGSATAVLGPDGSLISLTGSANGNLALDTWGVATFSGSISVTTAAVTVTGTGSVTGTNFPLGVTLSGSFTEALGSQSWTFSGAGGLHLGPINVASARLNFAHDTGMNVDHVGFYFSILFIPTYFELNIKLNPSGGCDNIKIVGGSFLAAPALALILPALVDCPVSL